MINEIEFLFEGDSVGLLFERPNSECEVRYEPYRGIGHKNMQDALREGDVVICEIAQKPLKKTKQKVKRPIWCFTVYSCPEYGVLKVSKQREKI